MNRRSFLALTAGALAIPFLLKPKPVETQSGIISNIFHGIGFDGPKETQEDFDHALMECEVIENRSFALQRPIMLDDPDNPVKTRLIRNCLFDCSALNVCAINVTA